MIGRLLRTGAGATLVVAIMVVGSFVLWCGGPLLWLWIGSQIQGYTDSLSLALAVMAVGVGVTIWLCAKLLAFLSNWHRSNAIALGHEDPGHKLLENVLIVTAGIAIVLFGIWFLLFAGAGFTPIVNI
jgi:hypothetical protein